MGKRIETLKRTPPVSWLLKLTGLGYSTCGICGLPWKHCEHHNIMLLDQYSSFFPVCEYCWTHKSKEENLNAVKELYYEWKKMGYNEYTREQLINAFEAEWKRTH